MHSNIQNLEVKIYVV